MPIDEGTRGVDPVAPNRRRKRKSVSRPRKGAAPVVVSPDIVDLQDKSKARRVAEAAVIGHKKLRAKQAQIEHTNPQKPVAPTGRSRSEQVVSEFQANRAGLGLSGTLSRNALVQSKNIAKGFLPAMLETGKAVGLDTYDAVTNPLDGEAHSYRRTREDVIEPTLESYRWQYGPLAGYLKGEGDLGEFQKRFVGYDVVDPETGEKTLMGGPMGPILDATGFGKIVQLGKARALGKPAGIPAEARTLPLGSGRNKVDVQIPTSPNPLTRKSAELYDEFSKRYDKTPVVGRLVGSTKRAGRQAARELRRGQTRAMAGSARHARAIQRVSFDKVGPRGRDDLRTSLFWDAHLPDDLRGPEGLQTIRDDLDAELNKPLPLGDIPEAKGLVAQRRRVESATKRYEAALERADGNLSSATVVRFGAAASREKDKLRTQELRHARKVARRDLDGLRDARDHIESDLDSSQPGSARYDQLDEQLDRIEKQIAEKEQVTAFASARREKQLRQRIEDLDKAIIARRKIESNPKAKAKYEQALVGAAHLTDEMEQIKLDAFGPELAEQFAARRGILGKGESDIYMRHTAKLEGAREKVAGKPNSGVFGRTDTRGLLGGGENELILYKYGALATDPDVVIESYLRAQSFKYLNNVKKLLSEVGEDIPVGGQPNPGWYVVNPNGRVLPSWWKAIEDGDDGVFLDAVKAYGQQILGKSDDASSMRNFVDPETGLPMTGVRQVDPRIIESMFGKHGSGPGRAAGPVGQVADVTNQLVKTSLLYLNPGYIPANLAGNLVFLGVQQPAHAIPNLLRSARTIWHDRERADLIEAEIGHGPTMSVAAELQPGQSLGVRATLNVNRKIANRVSSLSDNWPRMAAWYYEARKAGYKSREDQLRLLRGETPELERIRMEVRSRAEESMVNFDRLGPDEKAILGRVFFVWPWIRGATAYAGRFALDHPEKAAIIRPNAEQEAEEIEETLGKLKSYLTGVIPTGPVDGNVVEVLSGGPISPLSTALEMEETVEGLINALVNDEPTPKYRKVGDMITPILGTVIAISNSENAYGSEVGQRESLIENLRGLSPAGDLIGDVVEPSADGAYPEDATRTGRLKRAARILPYKLDLEKARDDAVKLKGPEAAETKDLEAWTKVYGELPPEVVEARKLQTAYRVAREVLKKQVDAKKLTDKQNLAVKLGVWAQKEGVSQADVEEGQGYLREMKSGSDELKAMDAWLERELGWSTALAWAHKHDGRG